MVDSEIDSAHHYRVERTDNQLVDLVLDGDETAFEQLFERHKRLVAMIAGRHFRRYEEIEEIVQVAFAKAFVQMSSFRGKYDKSFSSWLVTITANSCLDLKRSQRRKPERLNCELDDDEAESLFEMIAAEDARTEQILANTDLAEKLLSNIDPQDRTLLEMLYADELSVAEIAAQQGMTASNVKVRAWRARAALKKVLKKYL